MQKPGYLTRGLGGALNAGPFLFQIANIGEQLYFADPFGGRSNDKTAHVTGFLLDQVFQSLSLSFVFDSSGHSDVIGIRHKHQIPCG